MTNYEHGHHTVYHHRYHIVWITKYRYRVLQGELRLRVREIIAQVAEEMRIQLTDALGAEPGLESRNWAICLRFWKNSDLGSSR